MKAVYTHNIIIKLNINGKWETNKKAFGRHIYKYGEVPKNYVEKFDNQETVFYDLAKKIGYKDTFCGLKTFWKKRTYLELFSYRIYKDSLKAMEIQHIFEIVDNPIIEYLEKDLGFKKYSELIFDRENELKGMLNNKN